MVNTEINPQLIQQLLNISIKEFMEKTWAVSEQYLAAMEVLTEDALPVIAKIEKEDDGGFAVYFTVKDENFFYTHYFDVYITEIIGIDITPASEVYLSVHSTEKTVDKLLQLTTLIPNRRHNKGDKRGNGNNPFAIWKDSRFTFQPDENNAGNFEKKLIFLLNQLFAHQDDLKKLRKVGCELYITAYWEAYIGNAMLGGFYLNNEIIKKLNDLELEIDFDINVSGKLFG